MSLKRGRASNGTAAKRAKNDVVPNKINAIVNALRDETFVSEVSHGARGMLAAGASSALGSFVEDRHAMQTTLVDYMQTVFSEITKRIESDIAAAQQAVEERKTELKGLTSHMATATAEVEEAETAARDQKEKFSLKEVAVRVATSEAKEALTRQQRNTREKDALEKEKTKYQALDEEYLKALIDGTISEEKEIKKMMTKLTKDMERIGAEPALLTTVGSVFLKKLESRQSFDNVVVESLKSVLAAKLASVEELRVANEIAAKEVDEEVVVKDEAVENKRKEAAQEGDVLTEAYTRVEEKRVAKVGLDSQIDECRASQEASQAVAETALQKAAEFKEVTEDLNFLVARSCSQEVDNVTPVEAQEAALDVILAQDVA